MWTQLGAVTEASEATCLAFFAVQDLWRIPGTVSNMTSAALICAKSCLGRPGNETVNAGLLHTQDHMMMSLP